VAINTVPSFAEPADDRNATRPALTMTAHDAVTSASVKTVGLDGPSETGNPIEEDPHVFFS